MQSKEGKENDTIYILEGLSDLYIKFDQHQKAEETLQQALLLAKNSKSNNSKSDNWKTISILESLGKLQAILGNYKQADNYYALALDNIKAKEDQERNEEVGNKKSKNSSNSYNRTAIQTRVRIANSKVQVLVRTQQYQQALPICMDILKILEKER